MKSTFKNEPIFYIHSNLSSSEVLQTIDQFKETTHGYIVAVDMLNEGVHIDGVNTIIMLRKTKSPSVYKQQIGRALSSASPNELVYVFDFVGNSSEILSYYKISYNPNFQESDGINSYTVSDIGTKIPKISTQNIVDDSTKEIISIINQIQKFSKIKVYKDSELIEILNSCSTYEEAIEKTGLSYGYITSRAKELGLGDKLWDNRRSYDRDKIIPILEECNTSAEVAERLGLDKLKQNLYDNVIRLEHPDEYRRLKMTIESHREENEKQLAITKERIQKILDDLKINGEIVCRIKHISSIFNKLHNKRVTLDQIYDILAMRVIVDTVEECYSVLGRIHSIYKPMAGRVKDYIASPKPNGYKSLHTTIIVENQHPLEVQIRTKEMHRESEFGGVCAHWLYKEKKDKKSDFDNRLTWFRQTIENAKSMSNEEFIETLKSDLYDGVIIVQTPKGRVITDIACEHLGIKRGNGLF